jgi:hypothetical protein
MLLKSYSVNNKIIARYRHGAIKKSGTGYYGREARRISRREFLESTSLHQWNYTRSDVVRTVLIQTSLNLWKINTQDLIRLYEEVLIYFTEEANFFL